jgi:hypothetical protein
MNSMTSSSSPSADPPRLARPPARPPRPPKYPSAYPPPPAWPSQSPCPGVRPGTRPTRPTRPPQPPRPRVRLGTRPPVRPDCRVRPIDVSRFRRSDPSALGCPPRSVHLGPSARINRKADGPLRTVVPFLSGRTSAFKALRAPSGFRDRLCGHSNIMLSVFAV